MTLMEKGARVVRWLANQPQIRPAPGRFLVMDCPDDAGLRESAIEAMRGRGRAIIVGGSRGNYTTCGTVRASLVTASRYGWAPPHLRGARLTRVVQDLALQSLLEEQVEELPSLARFRAGLGIGLLQCPDVLIVDEPGALPEPDRTGTAALFRKLQLRTRVTTVWLTSQPDEIAGLADQSHAWGTATADRRSLWRRLFREAR